MRSDDMDRREFLERSGRATVGATVMALSGGTMLIATDGAWALELQALDGAGASILLRMTRLLYPHDSLGDQYYAAVVEALDTEAKGDAEAASLLKDGVAGLQQAYPVPFLDLSEGHQLQALKAIESEPFFQKVRAKVVAVLYNSPGVWQAFGYEGASYDDGGYIERGFDDLGWLPAPPEDASPHKA